MWGMNVVGSKTAEFRPEVDDADQQDILRTRGGLSDPGTEEETDEQAHGPGACEDDVLGLEAPVHAASMETAVAIEEPLALADLAGGLGPALAFIPLGHGEQAGVLDLAVELMIEVLFLVRFSIVDGNGG